MEDKGIERLTVKFHTFFREFKKFTSDIRAIDKAVCGMIKQNKVTLAMQENIIATTESVVRIQAGINVAIAKAQALLRETE